MNQKEMISTVAGAGFADLNGQILRICNLLNPVQCTLNAVYGLFKNNPSFACTEQQVRQSITYLCNSGYLAVDHPDGLKCLDEIASGGFGTVRLCIQAKGTQLLMGAIQDPCVEN